MKSGFGTPASAVSGGGGDTAGLIRVDSLGFGQVLEDLIDVKSVSLHISSCTALILGSGKSWGW